VVHLGGHLGHRRDAPGPHDGGQAKRAATTNADPAGLGALELVSASAVEEWAKLGLR